MVPLLFLNYLKQQKTIQFIIDIQLQIQSKVIALGSSFQP